MNSRFRNTINLKCSGTLMTSGMIVILFCILALIPSAGLHGMDKGYPARGEESFNKRLCAFCHALNGRGGNLGPDLNEVKQRRSKEWLFKWLKNPQALKSDSIMPKESWTSDQEIYDVISYLTGSGKDTGKE